MCMLIASMRRKDVDSGTNKKGRTDDRRDRDRDRRDDETDKQEP